LLLQCGRAEVAGNDRDGAVKRVDSDRHHITVAVNDTTGIAGLVCSPHEIQPARGAAPGLFIVVPGIRPATGPGAAPGDQKRVATAAQAIDNGADYLVVGRPIRDAADPVKAFEALVEEVKAAV